MSSIGDDMVRRRLNYGRGGVVARGQTEKAKALANEISVLANLARGAKFEIVTYMLELAAKEPAKES